MIRAKKELIFEVKINEEIKLVGDQKKINQVFKIIIDNALKYYNQKLELVRLIITKVSTIDKRYI